jgi:hypothetical protein
VRDGASSTMLSQVDLASGGELQVEWQKKSETSRVDSFHDAPWHSRIDVDGHSDGLLVECEVWCPWWKQVRSTGRDGDCVRKIIFQKC